MPLLAFPPTSAQLRAITQGRLIHLSRQGLFGKIVRVCDWRPGADAAWCSVHIKPTVGAYKNLSVIDPARLRGCPKTAYVYWFLGVPGRLQRGLNVQNAALLPGWTPPPDEMQISVSGADVLAQCDGRIFYRVGDRCVASFGDFIGKALVSPVPIGLPTA